jgi:hypothetical protein
MSDDEMVVKSVWKSARAVLDWPGMVTIRRFSPFKNEKVEGHGATEAEAWKNTADKIRAIWAQDFGNGEEQKA